MKLCWEEEKERIQRNIQERLKISSEFELLSIFNNHLLKDVPKFNKIAKINLKNKIENSFFLGDNLECMKFLLQNGYENKFDMIYIDPPFFTENIFTIKKKIKTPTGEHVKITYSSYNDKWDNSLQNYLTFLYERFLLIKSLLSPTGNLFVHLDWHASHYVKILLDEIFGYDNFRNEIVWCYTGPSRTSTDFPRKHDIILRYSKTENPRFYPVRVPYKSGVHDTKGTALNYRGRKVDIDLISRKGKIIEDWWTDIWATERYRNEYLYFDTQKPLKLLERIIKSTTQTNDLVGDFFAGSGTTIIAAEKLQRKWIGCDASAISYVFTTKRINHFIDTFNRNIAFKTLIEKKFKEKIFFFDFSTKIKSTSRKKDLHRIKFVLKKQSNNLLEIDIKDYKTSLKNITGKNKGLKIDSKELIEYIKIGTRIDDAFYYYNFLRKKDETSIYHAKINLSSIVSQKNPFYLEIGDLFGNIIVLELPSFSEKERLYI